MSILGKPSLSIRVHRRQDSGRIKVDDRKNSLKLGRPRCTELTSTVCRRCSPRSSSSAPLGLLTEGTGTTCISKSDVLNGEDSSFYTGTSSDNLAVTCLLRASPQC